MNDNDTTRLESRLATLEAKICPEPPVGTGRPGTGFAIASLVLGIVWLYGVGAILAIVFSQVSKSRDAAAGKPRNGMATAGLVLGIIGVVGAALVWFAIFALIGSGEINQFGPTYYN
ncbi:MAG: DUF4190 domain-containing protein [Acidimicrobiia bacterium]